MDKGLEKSLLGQILGLFRIHHQTAGQAINLLLVLLYQFLEGREITLLRPGYEVRVGHGASSPGFIILDTGMMRTLNSVTGISTKTYCLFSHILPGKQTWGP
jgi:hypothetical protein